MVEYLQFSIIGAMAFQVIFHIQLGIKEKKMTDSARISHIMLLLFSIGLCVYSLYTVSFDYAWVSAAVALALSPVFCSKIKHSSAVEEHN